MFAIIKTGGKQYKVKKDSILSIEKLDGETGSRIEFTDVLMMGNDLKPSFIGTPLVKGAKVVGEIMHQTRGPKIIVFKKKRRKNYRRKLGHKQHITEVKIIDISKE